MHPSDRVIARGSESSVDMHTALARYVIAHLGQSGTPPEEGVELYTVGLDVYLEPLQKEYLETLLPDGISSFKLVVGSYGGGKTHFLYCVRTIAESLGYVVTYVPLSPAEAPFHQLDEVYRAIVQNIRFPLRYAEMHDHMYNRGIESFLRYTMLYLNERLQLQDLPVETARSRMDTFLHGIQNIESASFRNAMAHALRALFEENEERFHQVVQWLKGENPRHPQLRERHVIETLTPRTAFRWIRSLAQWVREIGLPGTVFLFDEAERAISLGHTRQVVAALDNLRQWIDECGQRRFPGVLTLYAVPDELMLMDRPGPSYEALKQRLQTVFSRWEPTGVKIYLERLQIEPIPFLLQIGQKLMELYQRAYQIVLPQELTQANIRVLAHRVYHHRFADISYRRLFITTLIPLFHRIRQDPTFVLTDTVADEWIQHRLIAFREQDLRDSDAREF